MPVKIKRIYDPPAMDDGLRVLVDRLWPRGIKKSEARVDLWLRDIAPSSELRKWFGHREDRWEEFRKRYFNELEEKKDLLGIIVEKSVSGDITLLYSAKNTVFNNAIVLKEYIEKHMLEER